MKTNSSSLLILLITALLSSNAFAQKDARVTIHVPDGYGTPIKGAAIRMSGNGETAFVPSDTVFTGKFGRFTLDVEVIGFEGFHQEIVIDQLDQIITVAATKLGQIDGPLPDNQCVVRGRVPSGSGAERIRLMGLWNTYLADTPVKADGSFEYRVVECADYMLIYMGPKGCLGTQLVRSSFLGNSVSVKLGPPSDAACGPNDIGKYR